MKREKEGGKKGGDIKLPPPPPPTPKSFRVNFSNVTVVANQLFHAEKKTVISSGGTIFEVLKV